MRSVGITMRIAPRIVRRAGDGELQFHELVIRLEVRIRHGPVDPDPVYRMDTEIGGMQSRGERCPVNGSSSHPLTAVVRSKRQRVLTAGDPHVVPIEVMGSLLVTDPITLGVPERTGIEANHSKSGPCQPLQQHAPSGADTHDDVVYFLRFGEALHWAVDSLDRTEHV